MPRSRTLPTIVSGAIFSLALVSCSVASPMPVPPAPSARSTVTPAGDGVLRIGTLFPSTGVQSYLGAGQAAGVALAVKEINDAGGVLGKPVEVLARDSGDVTTTTIESSIADLVSAKADVLIGPSSSVLAERVIPKIVVAKLPMISPAATSSGTCSGCSTPGRGPSRTCRTTGSRTSRRSSASRRRRSRRCGRSSGGR